MREIARNLTRRKLRSALTISGITVGVLALTTMGALAENFRTYTAGAVSYFSDHIQVTYANQGDFGGNLLQASKSEEIARVDGVTAAYPVIQLNAKASPRGIVSITPADYIFAADPNALRLNGGRPPVAQGRELAPDDNMAVVLGADFADELKASVGQRVELPIPDPGKPSAHAPLSFVVVGILRRTFTVPDSGALMTRMAGVRVLANSLAPSISSSADPASLATGVVVYGRPGEDLDTLAARITRQVSGVNAQPPSEQVASYQSASSLLTTITLSAAILAVVIGGVSVINTMLMAVTERVKEIGLKKAVGAKTRHLVREFLMESALIGFLGGVTGVALGLMVIALLNAAAGGGHSNFLVTPQLVLLSLFFAVALGGAAGVTPAIRAARLDPVVALRST